MIKYLYKNFIRSVKYHYARYLFEKMQPIDTSKITEQTRVKFNFLQAQIYTKGNLPWEWKKLK